MINRHEIHATWVALVQAWRIVWAQADKLERWAAFMPHCDRLLAHARQQGVPELEQALEPLLNRLGNLSEPTEADKQAVDRLLSEVFVVVRDVCSDSSRRPTPSQDADHLPLVVLLSDQTEAMRELLLQMEHYGYAFRIFPDYRAGLQVALNQRAIAVVIDLGQGFDAKVVNVISMLNHYGVKWFAVSERGDFAFRLQAVRQGAHGFFVAPLGINPLVDAVDPIAYKAKDEPYRVLVLDDSLTVLAMVEKTLAQFDNITVRTLRQPAMVLDTLMDFSPDVLLLDFHMEDCTGLEVAKIIRQNKAFESIPIVYFTSETSESVQLEAMRHGGDDFLTKPISQTQLANAVISKSERYRGLRKLMVEDSLTGLYNHVKTKALLQQSLLLAERQGVPVSYVILDIDHFKKVNDTYGHTVGDKIIKTLARFLKQRVRRADVVGRYGGEEFVIVLFNTTPQAAWELVDNMRELFSKVFHPYDEGVFSVSFSAGVAHYPGYLTMMELMVAADDALYAAKRAGRNCVMCAQASQELPRA